MSAHPKRCAHCWKTSGENDNLAKELHNSTGEGEQEENKMMLNKEKQQLTVLRQHGSLMPAKAVVFRYKQGCDH